MSDPKRKKITKLGWGVKWTSGQIEFFTIKQRALKVNKYYTNDTAILFRAKLEEVVK